MITINCGIRCENGQAPAEDTVDAMLRQLKSYAEAKYPKLTKVAERQYWNHSKEPDFNFAIFWDLEDKMKDDSLSDVQRDNINDMKRVPRSVGNPEHVRFKDFKAYADIPDVGIERVQEPIKTHYCGMCDEMITLPHDCKVPFPFPIEPTPLRKPDVIKAALGQQNVYAKQIWNEAIEAAALRLELDKWKTFGDILRKELKK